MSWWPGNVEVGGTHIHHLVWGILLLLIFGYIGVAIAPGSPWHEIVAVVFGIGTGLTLDEFALWLNLDDVYWSEKGRRSIDAVIVAGCVRMVLVGFGAWLDVATTVASRSSALGIVAVGEPRQVGVAAIGLLVPPVGRGAFGSAGPARSGHASSTAARPSASGRATLRDLDTRGGRW